MHAICTSFRSSLYTYTEIHLPFNSIYYPFTTLPMPPNPLTTIDSTGVFSRVRSIPFVSTAKPQPKITTMIGSLTKLKLKPRGHPLGASIKICKTAHDEQEVVATHWAVFYSLLQYPGTYSGFKYRSEMLQKHPWTSATRARQTLVQKCTEQKHAGCNHSEGQKERNWLRTSCASHLWRTSTWRIQIGALS